MSINRLSQGYDVTRNCVQVPVSLQYQERLKDRSRKQRQYRLRERFAQLAEEVKPLGVEVDLDSLVVSSQTVEALLPLEDYEEIVERLTKEHVRVDRLIDRQIVNE